MNISSSPIVMFAALLTFSCAAYSVEKGNIFSQNARSMDPIAFSQQSFNNLTSYQVMMRSSSPSEESKIIRYSFQKPGYVRMDFTQPHSGAVLIFNSVSGKVTLWPFGVGSLPILHLSPTNSLIQDERGHRVDRSDIGVLLGNIRHLQREGTMTTVGKENLAGRATTHVSVVGPGTMVVDGVHRYDVWLDNYHGLPAKVISYAPDGQRLETVLLDAMVINIRFPANFFSP
ncbi:LolA family protein [Citrobacter freundii]|uniref:LolA family protein n=1 Tax=Citrobacter freundii TaxID=546 RepID=UPI0023B11528|nr:DUF1571 domain-containing protein [Citrobacter freundii]